MRSSIIPRYCQPSWASLRLWRRVACSIAGTMWSQKNADLIPELAGPNYVRHEMGGTRTVTAEEYRDQTATIAENWTITDMRYSLVAEGDRVVAIGTWKVNGNQMDWVQCFRVAEGKLVETWLSGIGTASKWDDRAFSNVENVRIPD